MYFPFGEEITPQNDGNYKFTGKLRDKETGLDYFGARYYSSKIYRWTSVDPISLKKSSIIEPQKLNLYNYCTNNPVIKIDFDGLIEHFVFILNNKDMSVLIHLESGKEFEAFSGDGKGRNNSDYQRETYFGPIPEGGYYIVDHDKGFLNRVASMIDCSKKWYRLYSNDGRIDDEVFVDGVKRDQIRLHLGEFSLGCLTIKKGSQPTYKNLVQLLEGTKKFKIFGTNINYYGRVYVIGVENLKKIINYWKMCTPHYARTVSYYLWFLFLRVSEVKGEVTYSVKYHYEN